MDKKEMLSKVKEDMIKFSCEQNGHQYGLWSKNEYEGKYEYRRECLRCKYIEILRTSEPQPDQEKQISKQKESENILNLFYQEKDSNLDSENILFYIYCIRDYLSYLDLNKLQTRINELNKPLLESLEEYRLISVFSQNINNVPDELWEEIESYVKNIMATNEKAHH